MTMNLTEMRNAAGEAALDLTKPKKSVDLPSPPSMDALRMEPLFGLPPDFNVHHPRNAPKFSPTLPESATTESRNFPQQLLSPIYAAQMHLSNCNWKPGFPNFHQPMMPRPPMIQIMPKTHHEMAPALHMMAAAFPKQENRDEENNNFRGDHADSTVRTSPSISSSESDSMDFCKSPEMMKTKRPFKIYAKELTNYPMDFDNPEEYELYKAQVMERMVQSNKTTNKNMRRSTTYSQEDKHNDPAYRERRRKNNAAAKRSRDARRAKEDEMAIRCEYLTRSNIRLKQDIAVARDREERLKQELERLNAIVMTYQAKQIIA